MVNKKDEVIYIILIILLISAVFVFVEKPFSKEALFSPRTTSQPISKLPSCMDQYNSRIASCDEMYPDEFNIIKGHVGEPLDIKSIIKKEKECCYLLAEVLLDDCVGINILKDSESLDKWLACTKSL